MSINRIQKLLFSEYCDFEDMVLVESPFAQTTREGKGIRQVHLGLTPTRLVLATDILPSANESQVTYLPGIDPDIETFELVAVYPVECLNLSVFHRRKRQSLKAHFCNNRILYFELGGFENRKMFWTLWCERIKFLSPEDPGSSHSETSVATSTSNSTLYLLATRRVVTNNGTPQFWYKFGTNGNFVSSVPKWTDRYLNLSKESMESSLNYKPIVNSPTISQFVMNKQKRLPKNIFSLPTNNSNSTLKKTATKDNISCMVNRFGKGVNEGCISPLFLTEEKCIRTFNEVSVQYTDNDFTIRTMTEPLKPLFNYVDLTENAVKLWELAKDTNPNAQKRGRHRRRYGLAPQPHFLHGLGPWCVSPGERFSVQVKRAVSVVTIRRQPTEPELRLPVSRRQLITSISCENLHLDNKINTNANNFKLALKRPIVFFWTPEYWYRPRSAKDAYQELLNHLRKLRAYCQSKSNVKKKEGRRRLFRKSKSRRNSKSLVITDTDDMSEDFSRSRNRIKKRTSGNGLLNSVKAVYDKQVDKEPNWKSEETSLEYLRRILRMEVVLTAWDFDSATLAYQITLIDRDLFLKIPSMELGILFWQQSSKNAPNIGALQAFSHRISCLVATEILQDDTEKIRARLIARLINVAEKCHKLSNFQSCRSVLCGLQSPAVYRLHLTWTYVRKCHATKYQIFETLCRLYRDPRLPLYQKTFLRASQEPPFLPYIGDIIAKLLNRIPHFHNFPVSRISSKANNVSKTSYNSTVSDVTSRKTLKQILSSFKICSSPKDNSRRKTIENEQINRCSRDNFDSIIRLNNTIQLLEKSQRAAAAYVFRRNDLAREYLLKARYREDRENFLNSFSTEKTYIVENDYSCQY